MYLQRIILQNYKNIRSAELTFSAGINCISGNNGAGKTNLLDAIYYLSMTKSFLSPLDQYVCTFGEETSIINGLYQGEGPQQEMIAVSLKKNGNKQIKRAGKIYTRMSDHIGLIPLVIVSPSDSVLINDTAGERRKYMNFILSQTDKRYLSCIQRYSALITSRNKLLKEPSVNEDLLDAVTEQIYPYAQYIFEARTSLEQALLPLVKDYYSRLSGNKEEVSLEYASDLKSASISEIYAKDRERDKALGYTSSGVHRDDLHFLLNGYPVRKCASQGQQKSFLLALKLAQFSFMKGIHRTPPILLLDDVFDKLDKSRVEYLLGVVSGEGFGQIFITDSNKVRVESVVEALGADSAFFNVENGEYSTR